jgi:hypothetical protein
LFFCDPRLRWQSEHCMQFRNKMLWREEHRKSATEWRNQRWEELSKLHSVLLTKKVTT